MKIICVNMQHAKKIWYFSKKGESGLVCRHKKVTLQEKDTCKHIEVIFEYKEEVTSTLKGVACKHKDSACLHKKLHVT